MTQISEFHQGNKSTYVEQLLAGSISYSAGGSVTGFNYSGTITPFVNFPAGSGFKGYAQVVGGILTVTWSTDPIVVAGGGTVTEGTLPYPAGFSIVNPDQTTGLGICSFMQTPGAESTSGVMFSNIGQQNIFFRFNATPSSGLGILAGTFAVKLQ